MVSTFAERFKEEGLQQGMQQGLEQGKQLGLQQGGVRREGLIGQRAGLLQRKFGADVLAPYRSRVERADPDTLLAWSERILTAATIDEVFDGA